MLTEINNLRTELKITRTRCFEMESILGLSARYIPPITARAKLKHVTEDRERLDEKFNERIGVSIFVNSVLRRPKISDLYNFNFIIRFINI